MSLAPQPVGQAAVPRARHRALHPLVADPGRDRRALRLQRRPLADDVAGLLDPLVHGRDAAASSTTPPCRARSSTRSSSASLCVLVATPLGVALALGLQRWRGPGGGTINTVMLLPLVTPEIVMGVALLLLFLQVLPGIGLGSTAQAIGQVTFTLSYVVVIVRGRLVSIGQDYEEAAADLGAPPHDQLLRVLLPLLAPAIIASAAVVFAHLARRLRRHAVPLGRREHDHRVDAALRLGPRLRRRRRSMRSPRSRSSSRSRRSGSPSSSTGGSPSGSDAAAVAGLEV